MTQPTDNPKRNCGSPDHGMHRRLFLEGSMAGAASALSFSGLFSSQVVAEEIKQQGKRCILLWLCGAPSQFETWDPKPGKRTSGPVRRDSQLHSRRSGK